jgi:hypothetical protein
MASMWIRVTLAPCREPADRASDAETRLLRVLRQIGCLLNLTSCTFRMSTRNYVCWAHMARALRPDLVSVAANSRGSATIDST